MVKIIKNSILVLCVALLSIGIAFSVSANHSWGSYHWARTSAPFSLKLGDNVSSSWDSYLNMASSQWSLSSVLDTTVVFGNTNNIKGKNTPKNCTPTSGRIEVCSAKYGSTGWLGLAQIWVSGGHITQGTTKLNDTYFTTSAYNTPGWKSLVLCQEVGHNFGLDHQDEDFNNAPVDPHTCMDYFVPGVNEIVGPNTHDYEQLEAMYLHLDSTTTIKSLISSNRLGTEIDFENPSEWGKSLKKDNNGKDNLFVRDLGNGKKVFTHIFWAR